MAQTRIGGSFAPPLSDELLVSYKARIEALPASATKDALAVLHNCCARWWDLPESAGPGKPHPLGIATIVPLDAAVSLALWDHIPWRDELHAMQALFDRIPAGDEDLRDCAFHLLWHAIELERDREPLTNDKLTTA